MKPFDDFSTLLDAQGKSVDDVRRTIAQSQDLLDGAQTLLARTRPEIWPSSPSEIRRRFWVCLPPMKH
jgi:hypothetical protein